MWMYDELGRGLAAQGPPPADHPYREWLILHAGPHLNSVTAWLRAALDRLAVALLRRGARPLDGDLPDQQPL